MSSYKKDEHLEERVEKLERIIYGDGLTNGLIYNIASIQQQLKSTDEKITELQRDIESINKMVSSEIKQLRNLIEDYNKQLSRYNNMVLRLVVLATGISASVSFIVGVIISSILHI